MHKSLWTSILHKWKQTLGFIFYLPKRTIGFKGVVTFIVEKSLLSLGMQIVGRQKGLVRVMLVNNLLKLLRYISQVQPPG